MICFAFAFFFSSITASALGVRGLRTFFTASLTSARSTLPSWFTSNAAIATDSTVTGFVFSGGAVCQDVVAGVGSTVSPVLLLTGGVSTLYGADVVELLPTALSFKKNHQIANAPTATINKFPYQNSFELSTNIYLPINIYCRHLKGRLIS